MSERRLRLMIVSSEFPPGPGGIGTHALHVALQLHARGWDVSVVALQDVATDDEIQLFNASLPFAVHRIRRFGKGPTKLAHRTAVISRLVRRERPTLLLGSGERMVWLAAGLARWHRIPFVAVGHAMEFNRHPRWQYVLTRMSYESALGAICVSKYTWSRMEGCDIRVRSGSVIPNGADETRFTLTSDDERTRFRRAHGLEDATLIITVGSVHERKGQDVVIRALPRVLETIPNVHYLVVGIPYRREAFGQLASELGVADRVHFMGAVEPAELVSALNAADLFVMASNHTAAGDFEGFGIAVLEAALCGRAAVVSDNSGVVEAIEPGTTGLTASVGDPRSTAERIVELLSDRKRLDEMGRIARQRTLALKTWAKRGEQYDAVLRRLVGAHELQSRPSTVNTNQGDSH